MKTHFSPDSAPNISEFRRSFITASENQYAATVAIIFCVLSLGIVAVGYWSSPHHKQHRLLPLLLIAGVTLLFGLAYYNALKRIYRTRTWRRNDAIGLDLNNEDKIALYAWYRYGAMPTSKRLRPILSNYLDYLERIFNGQMFYFPRRFGSSYNVVFLAIFVSLQLFSGTIHLLHHPPQYGGAGLNYIFAFIFGALYYPSKNKNGRLLVRKLNSRSLRKLANMRQQLAAMR